MGQIISIFLNFCRSKLSWDQPRNKILQKLGAIKMAEQKDQNKQLPKRNLLIQHLESETSRKVTIETNESDDVISRCLPQDGSPLFTVLPREIRDLIWAFATAPFEDEHRQYDEKAYFYRPGHTARLKTDFCVLLTCRRVWRKSSIHLVAQELLTY
jgi:hypothetical protein